MSSQYECALCMKEWSDCRCDYDQLKKKMPPRSPARQKRAVDRSAAEHYDQDDGALIGLQFPSRKR